MTINNGLYTSNTSEWETPQVLFDELNKEYNFKLDVCANMHNTKCKRYYTKEQDGLKQDWRKDEPDWKWMNPPYGRDIYKWVEKASIQRRVVALLPARTDTKWFHEHIYNKMWTTTTFIKGRLKFSGSKNSAPFPSMIVVFK